MNGSTMKLHMAEEKIRVGLFGQWWIIPSFIIVNHFLFIIYMLPFHFRVQWQLYAWSFFMGWLQLLGITGGYHRLWSHRAFSAGVWTRIFFALIGTSSFQGSIKWWVLRHRLHHRFTDTTDDPYDANRGLWFTHYGWLLEKPKRYPKAHLINMEDVLSDPVVEFQNRYIGLGYVWFGFAMPALIGHYYGDTIGGFMWVGVFSRIISWNGIFSVNSLSHWMGGARYSDHTTARGNLLCAVLGNGEGNHNYHHEFPKDYRHGVQWYEWDPTKWTVYVLSLLGLATNLWRSNPIHVHWCETQMKEKRAQAIVNQARKDEHSLEQSLLRSAASQDLAVSCDNRVRNDLQLPLMSWEELKRCVNEDGKLFVVIDGFVLDLTKFKEEHPGGSGLLRAFAGRDASDAFHGGLNNHTNTAYNTTKLYRVARIKPELGEHTEFQTARDKTIKSTG